MGWTPGPGPTAGDDTYVGDGTDETVSGGDGNDTLSGGGGNDTLNGDGGDDILSGGAGTNVLNGGNGADTLYSDIGADTMNGGADDDLFIIATVTGMPSVKIIDGGDGVDALILRSGGFATGSSLVNVETVYSQSSVYVTAGISSCRRSRFLGCTICGPL